MGLEQYAAKRDFRKTPEPQPPGRSRRPRRAKRAAGRSFVVQKHAATRLHYDFRLEHDGVLKSWAVPKGPSLDPADKRLAVQVEDHPLEYGGFEGVIPKGQYGGGSVLLWDRGTWEPEGDAEDGLRRGKLEFRLDGEKLRGRWLLVRTSRGGRSGAGAGAKSEWLLRKLADEEADAGGDGGITEQRPESVETGRTIQEIGERPRRVWRSHRADPKPVDPTPLPGAKRGALPDFIEPQLATLVAEAPTGEGWLHEMKLDGYRALCRLQGGEARLLTRRGNDWTDRFGSIASAAAFLPAGTALLDGEVAWLAEDGRTEFQALQQALGEGREERLVYFAFDLLHLDGHDLTRAPLRVRKEALAALLAAAPAESGALRMSDHVEGRGADFFGEACRLGLEGIVSKRADAPYRPGRGSDWLKVKCLQEQELVIVGYSEPSGSRSDLGALLLGVRERPGDELRYAGKVGTGFDAKTLRDLGRRLAPLERPTPPVTDPPRGYKARGVHWVEPELVAQVAFTGWTDEGVLRHPSYKGLREDKGAGEVVRERPATVASDDGRARRGRAASSPGAAAKGAPAGGRRTKPAASTQPSKGAKRAQPTQRKPAASAKLAKRGAKPAASAKPIKRGEPAKPARATKPARAAKRARPTSTGPATKSAPRKPGSARAPKDQPTKSAKRDPAPAPGGKGARPGAGRRGGGSTEVAGVRLSNPDRVVFPELGLTKLDLARYYERVADRILPHLHGRALSLVRCPAGRTGHCFYQKHLADATPPTLVEVPVTERSGEKTTYVAVESLAGLISLVQLSVLEIHPWGSRRQHLERPDVLVFDLDPGPGLEWERVVAAARELRGLLAELSLESFVKLTGGKGLHVVVPIAPELTWEPAKAFCRAVVGLLAERSPERYTTVMAKARRQGRIFLDYLRNGFGSTAVAPYSTRARPGAPVAAPVRWEELGRTGPGRFDVANLGRRLASLRADPWEGFFELRQRVPAAVLRQLQVAG